MDKETIELLNEQKRFFAELDELDKETAESLKRADELLKGSNDKKPYNKIEYNNRYNKENYSRFNTVIKKDEMDKLNKLIDKHNMSKAELLRYAIKKLEEEK